MRAGLAWDYRLDDNPEYTEVYYAGDTWKLLLDLPRAPAAGEVAVLRIYHASATKRAVVQRDDDDLTAAEIIQYKDEIDAAMLQELKTWKKFNCFSRKARRDAKNIIDCRWVLKWKWDYDAVSVGAALSNNPPPDE